MKPKYITQKQKIEALVKLLYTVTEGNDYCDSEEGLDFLESLMIDVSDTDFLGNDYKVFRKRVLDLLKTYFST